MNKKILQLAVPNILSNISVPLLSAVDIALMGHLEKDIYIAAVAVGTGIFNFIYWGFGFLRMSTTGITAQALGRGDEKTRAAVLQKGLRIALIVGLIFFLIQLPLEWLALQLVESGSETKELISSYFRVRIFAAPATLALYVFHGWFLGMQNARIPLILTIFVNVLNMGLSYFLVAKMDMGSAGVALGTVIAQYTGLVMAIILFVVNYREASKGLLNISWLKKIQIKGYWQNNMDIILRTLCLVVTINFIVFRSGSLGERYLAVNALLLQLNYLMSYAVDGFAFAGESLSGLYLGRKERWNFIKATKGLMLWGVAFGALFGIFYFFFGKYLLQLFSSDMTLVEDTARFLPWFAILPLISAVAFVWDGIYLGATASRPMRNSMVISTAIFLVGWVVLLPFYGNHGIWMAFTLFMLSRAVFLTFMAPYWLFAPGRFK